MNKYYCTKNIGKYNIKILLILLIFIYACETKQTRSTIQNDIKEPSVTIRNSKCEDITSFKVFQVLDNFVLANACKDSNDEYCMGYTVYFKKEKGKIYFDDQIIKVKDNECAIYVGTYQYQTKVGYKTVPVVNIIDSRISNSE